jgi:hypothetical protein
MKLYLTEEICYEGTNIYYQEHINLCNEIKFLFSDLSQQMPTPASKNKNLDLLLCWLTK